MKNQVLKIGAVLVACGLPMMAQAQTNRESGAAAGATTGAVGGALVGGPVGAIVGGAAGAVIGGLSADQTTRVREYVVREPRPSVRVEERIVVGETLPETVEVYEVPSDVVEGGYRYTIVNERTVLVDPQSRRVVEIIE